TAQPPPPEPCQSPKRRSVPPLVAAAWPPAESAADAPPLSPPPVSQKREKVTPAAPAAIGCKFRTRFAYPGNPGTRIAAARGRLKPSDLGSSLLDQARARPQGRPAAARCSGIRVLLLMPRRNILWARPYLAERWHRCCRFPWHAAQQPFGIRFRACRLPFRAFPPALPATGAWAALRASRRAD
ncbi:hypothetical protein IWW54_007126, partial [Coemansia sp. RSA 2705]